MSTALCLDQVATAQQLADLYPCGISTAPKHTLPATRLAGAATDEDTASAIFDELQASVGAPLLPGHPPCPLRPRACTTYMLVLLQQGVYVP